MKNFIRFIVLIGMIAFFPPKTLPSSPDMERTPLHWGQSMQDVIRTQHIDSYIDEDTTSLLSGLAVHLLLEKSVFLGNKCSILYSFMNDRLIEYCIDIKIQDDARSDVIHEKVKSFLNSTYTPYNGPYFDEIEERFVDDKMQTCVLFIRDKNITIYFMESWVAKEAMKKQTAQEKKDMGRLVIH